MKYSIITFFLSIILSSALCAQEDNRVSSAEVETYLQSWVAKNVDESILSSDAFKECFEKGKEDHPNNLDERNKSIRACTDQKFNTGLDDEQITTLAEQLNLDAFDKNAAKSSKSIREYLSERLEKAIYGKVREEGGAMVPLSERTFTNHDNFYQLYMEQIGKNTLLQVSQYCLENFGYGKKHSVIQFLDKTTLKEIDRGLVKTGENYSTASDIKDLASNTTATPNFWKNYSELKEYEVCSGKDCDETGTSLLSGGTSPAPKLDTTDNNKRSVELVTALKNATFELSNGQAEVVAKNYEVCASEVVRNMCEIYKCVNIYDVNDTTKMGECSNNFGLSKSDINTKRASSSEPGLKLGTTNSKGQVACNVLEQLRSYRKALLATEDIMKKRIEEGGAGRLALQKTGVNTYQNEGDTSIDSLTSISSTELTTEVSDLSDSEESAEMLRENCLDEQGKLLADADTNNDCIEVLGQVTAEDLYNIEADSEAKAALFVKRLEELDGSSADELKSFLEENGLNEYLAKLEGEGGSATLPEAELIALIKDDFLTKKNAELDAIKKKFKEEFELAGKTEGDADYETGQTKIAKRNIEDIEKHKNRVQTLFQYSNIVSSYLTVEAKSGEPSGDDSANVTGRRLEISDAGESEDAKLLEYFSEGADQTRSGSTNFSYNSVFKAILGESDQEDEAQSP